MEKIIVYHVVTERPMILGQKIIFDDRHHSGVYNRVMDCKEIVDDIYKNPNKYKGEELSHHTKVALRELALEEVRQKEFSHYPSRMGSLYVSLTEDEANNWVEYFQSLGRRVFQLVKLEVDGNMFKGDAHNCFEGTTNKEKNLELAYDYWLERPNKKGKDALYEIIVDGVIEVIEIIKEYEE